MTRATPSIAWTRASKCPFSTKTRDVKTTETLAALQAAMTLAEPAVKFSIAGTRPIVCSAKNVTATPAELGSSTPTAAPSRRQHRRELGAEHLGADDQLFVGELGAERIFDDRLAGIARLARANERIEQRLIDRRRQHGGIGHDVLKRRARRLAAHFAAQVSDRP